MTAYFFCSLFVELFILCGLDIANDYNYLQLLDSTNEMNWAWAANRLIKKVCTALLFQLLRVLHIGSDDFYLKLN